MKAAKDYAKLAVQADQLATAVDPDERDVCVQALKLVVFHLRAAGGQLRNVAEFKAGREKAE